MNITKAIYLQSVVDWRKCPTGKFPEYAFIGRSNVGKSSLINMLTRHSGLAKTSSKPGKTQTINHFLINDNWYLVDLPGYGYASISKTMREKWTAMIDHYLNLRPNLQLVFVLIDSRLEPQKNDLEFIDRLGENGVPFAVVFTKTDKVSKLKVSQNVAKFKEKMMETWEELPSFFLSSAEKGDGRDEILDYIEGISKQFDPSALP